MNIFVQKREEDTSLVLLLALLVVLVVDEMLDVRVVAFVAPAAASRPFVHRLPAHDATATRSPFPLLFLLLLVPFVDVVVSGSGADPRGANAVYYGSIL